MRTSFLISFVLGSALVACGGDDGPSGGVDAPPATVDAAPDAPAALMGLGQRCVPSMGGADCPGDLGCLGPSTSTTNNGMCTTQCAMNVMFTTNAQGGVPPQGMTGAETPNPAASNGTCTAAYTGGIGTAACNSPFGLTPAPSGGMLAPNTTYTVQYACGINCGANNTCPTGLTCNTTIMQCRVM